MLSIKPLYPNPKGYARTSVHKLKHISTLSSCGKTLKAFQILLSAKHSTSPLPANVS